MPARKTEAEELAALCAQARTELTRAATALHDDIAPLLTAAGFRLQLARMDVPEAAGSINETLQILEQAMDHVRKLGQTLNPSPAYRGGFKDCLLQLAEKFSELEGLDVTVNYKATARVPVEIAAALYEVASAAVAEAVRQKAARIDLFVKGSDGIQIRVVDDGSKSCRVRNMSIVRRLAGETGIVVDISTRQSTIVSISYGIRRSTRR